MSRINHTSAEAAKHKYLRITFWLDENNHFWENESYTEKGKQMCRNRIAEKRKKEKKTYLLT